MKYNPLNANVSSSKTYKYGIGADPVEVSKIIRNNINPRLIKPVSQGNAVSLSNLSEIGNQLNANKKYGFTITAFWPGEPL
jgi:hypothetical protein